MKYLVTGGAGFIGSNYMHYVTEKYPESDVAADAYLRKAEIYSELKEYSSARQSYENFLKQFPQHPDAADVREKLNELEGY